MFTDTLAVAVLLLSGWLFGVVALAVAISAKADTRWVRRQLAAAMSRNAERQAGDVHRLVTNGSGRR